jgi:hypothetical protein
LSDVERVRQPDTDKLALKPVRTFVSSRQIDIIDLFSNNVVSERVRKDPREEENIDQEIIFETINEIDSEEGSENQNAIDEDITTGKNIEKYVTSEKHIHGLNAQDLESRQTVQKPDNQQVKKNRPSTERKEFRRNKTVQEVVYQEIDDETFFDLACDEGEDEGSMDVCQHLVSNSLITLYRREKMTTASAQLTWSASLS